MPRANSASLLAGLGPEAFLRAGGTAVDADKLDGKDSSAFLGKSETAADAETLDGMDSAGFIQGTGKGLVAAGSANLSGVINPASNTTPLGTVSGLGSFAVGGARMGRLGTIAGSRSPTRAEVRSR